METDDLVKRLRLGACALEIEQAAARIEELQAKLTSMALDCLVASDQAQEAHQAQLAAEAKLAKAVEERDEALNQLDSARHSVDVLLKRVADLKGGDA